MKYSKLFGKTLREAPKDEISINAKLLTRAGFIQKELSGVYNFLPLGLRVIKKISDIVRDEMNKTGAQELLLTTFQSKNNWEKTGRWQSFDALFKVKSQFESEYALGPTHEEVLAPLVKKYLNSYKNLPLYLYQIQTKFRDEKRAKSGLLRGREFLMKDLYSFHADEEDFKKYYEIMKKTYKKLFQRMGLEAIETLASGGSFTKDYSHEYQVLSEAGEDEIIYCPGGDYSANADMSEAKEGEECVLGHGPLKKAKAIEVGNIFPLKTKFSEDFNLTYKNKQDQAVFVVMGCYGIGISRLMGAIVEVYNDEKGIVWPESVAPFEAHLIHLGRVMASAKLQPATPEVKRVKSFAEEVYEKLQKSGVEILWDDREDVSAGEKFADADLIGIPVRLVVSEKLGGQLEWKKRSQEKTELVTLDEVINRLSA